MYALALYMQEKFGTKTKYLATYVTLRMLVKKYNYNDQTTEEEHVLFTIIQNIVSSVESSAFHRYLRYSPVTIY